MKLDLLTNATVVDDAIRFVSERQQTELRKLSLSGHNGKEEQQHQQQETKEIAVGELPPEDEESSPTTNKVF